MGVLRSVLTPCSPSRNGRGSRGSAALRRMSDCVGCRPGSHKAHTCGKARPRGCKRSALQALNRDLEFDHPGQRMRRNIEYRRSNGHKHRRTKRAGGRHATHAGHSKTCANTYPDPVPVHRCRCRCSPGVHITNYAIVAHISMSKMPLSSARHPCILSHVATQPKRQPRVSPTAAHVH